MCTWANVCEYLRNTLLPLVQSRDACERWLNALGEPIGGTVQGQALGTCLAIDLDSNAVPPKQVAELIDCLPSDIDNPCEAFAAMLRDHPDPTSLIGMSQHKAQSLAGTDAYARVLTLEGFIDVVGAELNLTPNDRAQARTYVDAPESMDHLPGRLRGRRGCAWVTRNSVLKNLLRRTKGGDNPATCVIAALGLYMTEGDDRELVLIVYPEECERQIKFAHPTSFDSRWNIPHYFMAYRTTDGFGRTHTLVQALEPCPERIHPNYEGLLDGFSAHSIGERDQIPHDVNAYLRAALERFCNGRHSSNQPIAA